MQDTKMTNIENSDETDNPGAFTIEYLIAQACDYLTLGINELFIMQLGTERCHFLLVLQQLLLRLQKYTSSLENHRDQFMETLYQAESLSRLAANVIFLEDEEGDNVNYLAVLQRLLSEARELSERKI